MNNPNISILVSNAVIYLLIVIVLGYKYKKLCLATFLPLFLAGAAISAIYVYQTTDSSSYNEVTILPMSIVPFIYLWIMYLLIYSPLLQPHVNNITQVSFPSQKWLNLFIYLIFFIYFVTIINIPIDFSFQNMDDIQSNYSDTIERTLNNEIGSNVSQFERLVSIIKGALTDFVLVLLVYCLIDRHYIHAGGLTICLLYDVTYNVSLGQRAVILEIILGFFFIYLVFKDALSSQAKRIFRITCITAFVLAVGAFVTITIARFSNRDNSIINYVLTYYSESFLIFNSHGLDPGGCRYADFTFPLIRRIFGLDYSLTMFDNLDKYSSLYSNCSVFNSVVGDFTMDFGILVATLFILLYALYMNNEIHQSASSTAFPFYQIILLVIIWRISTLGLVAFAYRGIGGNLKLLTDLLIYFYLRYDYTKQNK